MSVVIIRDPAARFPGVKTGEFEPLIEPPYTGEAIGATFAVLEAVFESCLAYHGHYSVDRSAGTVSHTVEGSNRPSFLDRILVRAFHFYDNFLELSPPAPEEFPVTLVWERLDS